MNNEKIIIDKEEIAKEYRKLKEGKIPQSAIEDGIYSLTSQNTAYYARGSITSVILYLTCKCEIQGGKTFKGSAWGAAFPGVGALLGDVYTDDINALYSKTHSFSFIATSVYTTFIFDDKKGNYLGSFQAAAISIVNGTGGGSGKWS